MISTGHNSNHACGSDQLSRLPDGVLVRIFEAVGGLSRSNLCSVSRVSKRCHILADAILYRQVRFLTPELHFIFSESLSRRARRGSAINDVKLAYPTSKLEGLVSQAPVHGPGRHHAPQPFDSLARTISFMSNLEKLEVAVPEALLSGIGHLFNGPFDLACLKSCTLFFQREDDQYWDLRENIHIFAHPGLETLVLKRAKLDQRGFDMMERPHETALSKLHLVECDISDDALSDLLEFPKALREFVMTQAAEPSPDLEESSDSIRDYMTALKSACHSLETVVVDFPSLRTSRPLALRDFTAMRTLRLNWDHQLFGKSSKKPRLHSAGLPPELETLEFSDALGTDAEVTDLLVYMLQNLRMMARNMKQLIVVENEEEGGVPGDVREACRLCSQLELVIIGQIDSSLDLESVRNNT